MPAGSSAIASFVTDDLAAWALSRVRTPPALGEPLFSSAAIQDLKSILYKHISDVAAAVVSEANPAKLDAFPLLASFIDMLGAQWSGMSQELAERLESDLEMLAERFNGGCAPGRVTAIHAEPGDRHRHGRSVLTLYFESGPRIVYKPRHIEADHAFNELLTWLSANGPLPGARKVRFVCRPGYGWTEYVEPAPASDASCEELFWQRTGILLALLDLLKARDCHWQNVIAADSHPVLVDAEGLFHRPLLDDVADGPSGTLSVLSTGLSPYWKRVAEGRVESSGGGSPSAQRIREVLEGYETGYQSLLSRRAELADPDGPLAPFKNVTVRSIFRDTTYYQALIHRACSRRYLAAVDAEAVLSMGQRSAPAGSRRRDIEQAEIDALRRLDIPRFTASVGSKDVDLDGRVVHDWFPETGLDVVLRRVHALSEAELGQKLEILRSAYALAALETSLRRRVSSTT